MYSLVGQARPPEGSSDSSEVCLLDVRVNGVLPSRMRHVIKRYLRKAGFRRVQVRHLPSDDVATMRLVASAAASDYSPEQMEKLRFLEESLIDVLTSRKLAFRPPPDETCSERLREKLAEVEPSLKKVYYARA